MKIKICGLTKIEDAILAVSLGATHIGLNFFPASPRYVDKQTAFSITNTLSKLENPPIVVGVFVNESELKIRQAIKEVGLQLAQLHGDESPDLIDQLGPVAFKAYRLGKTTLPNNLPSLCLVDAYVKGQYGGAGQTADWTKAASIARDTHIFLAGGLTPENVIPAIRQVQPWGVDVASGIEIEPGIKDPQLMRKFISNALSINKNSN
ncbi:MAG: N-(5'-phosphoribosyl)anthranilate isomerase [Anaerolineaceae bacterium]|nr:N-(5'-phosphoribosyl)anthranilate isomerase [Anaerolineaceae bacterium]|tara:strand:- start:127250 stop:127870 length:621 start_codon:yes stop_codon:yes gene_type:complete